MTEEMITSRLFLHRSIYLAASVYVVFFGVSLWMQWGLLSAGGDNLYRHRRDTRSLQHAVAWKQSSHRSKANFQKDDTADVPVWKLQLGSMIRTFLPHQNKNKNETAQHHHQHDPTKQRVCLALTATPNEMDQLQQIIERVWRVPRYANLLDCIHLSIPDRPIRVAAPKVSLISAASASAGQQSKQQKKPSSKNIQYSKLSYPNTTTLRSMFPDPRIILHRLPDFGPLTRYLGPLAFEQHPDTALLVMDMDSPRLLSSSLPSSTTNNDLVSLVRASNRATEAVFCYSGENFRVNQFGQVQPTWDNVWGKDKDGTTSGYHRYYTRVHLCRAAGGMLVKPKHFADMWYNQSEYHESCFWDDDRWLAFQFERQGFPLYKPTQPTEDMVSAREPGAWGNRESTTTLKNEGNSSKSILHRRLGSLSTVNRQLQSAVTCTLAWMNQHPISFPSARVTTSRPWDNTSTSRQNAKGGDKDDDEFIAQLEQDLEDSLASVQQKAEYQRMLVQYRGSKV